MCVGIVLPISTCAHATFAIPVCTVIICVACSQWWMQPGSIWGNPDECRPQSVGTHPLDCAGRDKLCKGIHRFNRIDSNPVVRCPLDKASHSPDSNCNLCLARVVALGTVLGNYLVRPTVDMILAPKSVLLVPLPLLRAAAAAAAGKWEPNWWVEQQELVLCGTDRCCLLAWPTETCAARLNVCFGALLMTAAAPE